jgi:hypothetical protein
MSNNKSKSGGSVQEDEPQVIDLSTDNLACKKSDKADTDGDGTDEWIPYVGDRGGEGWQTADGERVTYDDEPPGDKLDPEDAMTEVVGLSENAVGILEDTVSDVLGDTNLVSEERGMEVVAQHLASRQSAEIQQSTVADFTNFAEEVVEQELEEAQKVTNRPMWENVVYQELSNDSMLSDDAANRKVEELRSDVQDISDRFGTEVDEISGMMHEELANMDDDFVSEVGIDIAVEEAINYVEDDLSDENSLINMVDDEIIEAWDQDHLTGTLIDAAVRTNTSWGHDARSAVRRSELDVLHADEPTQEEMQSFLDQLESEGVDRSEIAGFVEQQIKIKTFPFRDFSGHIDPAFDPTEADEVDHFPDTTMGGGRSENSMFIARGVPDENGNKRDLFVTNTSDDRGDSQKPADGERCVAGSAGFQEAGFPVARYANVTDEFWVAEDAGGYKASDGSVDYNDLDQPIEQFTEMMAIGSVLGATDLHNDNVHVDPETGDLIPVDLDLIGAETHHEGGFDNRYRFDQSKMREKCSRVFRDLDMGEIKEFDEVWEAVKMRQKQLEEDGTLRDVASAAIDAGNNTTAERHIEENIIRAERGDFWPDPVDSPPGGMEGIREQLNLEERYDDVGFDDDGDFESLEEDVNQEVESGDIESMDDEEYNDAASTEPQEEPFTDYDGCVEYHDDKQDPGAYCAVIFGFGESDVEDEDNEEYEEDEYQEYTDGGDVDSQMDDFLSDIGP